MKFLSFFSVRKLPFCSFFTVSCLTSESKVSARKRKEKKSCENSNESSGGKFHKSLLILPFIRFCFFLTWFLRCIEGLCRSFFSSELHTHRRRLSRESFELSSTMKWMKCDGICSELRKAAQWMGKSNSFEFPLYEIKWKLNFKICKTIEFRNLNLMKLFIHMQ